MFGVFANIADSVRFEVNDDNGLLRVCIPKHCNYPQVRSQQSASHCSIDRKCLPALAVSSESASAASLHALQLQLNERAEEWRGAPMIFEALSFVQDNAARVLSADTSASIVSENANKVESEKSYVSVRTKIVVSR